MCGPANGVFSGTLLVFDIWRPVRFRDIVGEPPTLIDVLLDTPGGAPLRETRTSSLQVRDTLGETFGMVSFC